MNFDKPLIEGRLTRRYKRFFVDAEITRKNTQEIITAHCPNTGSMKGLLAEGNPVWLTQHNDPKRKLPYTLEVIHDGHSLVGVNTHRPNKIVQQSIKSGIVPQLSAYPHLRTEVAYGANSRVDLFLSGTNVPECYVEVKNVTLREEKAPVAAFPDAVTDRGRKHLLELAEMARLGHRAVMFFLVQRMDCEHFRPADEIDPLYGQTLRDVLEKGVEALCYDCEINKNGITLRRELPVIL
jgi:sugar fermentation stimulation protein A